MIQTYSQAEILAELLVQEGIGTRPADHQAWPLTITAMGFGSDDGIDNVLAVSDTEPLQDGRVQATGERIEHHGISIRIRSLTYQVGWRKAKEICDLLDSLSQVEVDMYDKVYLIHAATRSGINPLGTLELRRREAFTVNALLTLSELE